MPPPAAPPVRAIPHLSHLAHYHQRDRRHPKPRTIPDGQELIELITHGRGWVAHENDWIEVRPGDLIWNVAGETTVGRSDFENPYSCLAALFYVPTHAARPVPRFTRWEEIDAVQRFVRETVRVGLDPAFDRDALSTYVYARLRFQARLHGHRAGPAHLPSGLRRALRLIDTAYARPLSLVELATEAGWSVAHLHAMARQHTGDSPHQLLLQKRLQIARERLATTSEPIKTIAAECGFGSAAAFCHAFRTATGQTPATYRTRQAELFLDP